MRLAAGPRPTCCPPGRGNRAFRFCVSFSRLSPGTPAPPPFGAREGRLFGLFVQGPPGSCHPVGEAVRAEGVTLGDRHSLESALSLWPVLAPKCKIRQHLSPSDPWHLPVPSPQIFGPETASGKAKTCLVPDGCAFGSWLRNQESPTRCCYTSELWLSTAKQRHNAGAQGRVERSFSLKEESLRRHLLPLQSLRRLCLCRLGRWAPRIAKLMNRGKQARKTKAPTPDAQFGVHPPLRVFLSFLQQPAGFPAHPAASPRPEHWKAGEIREPARWRFEAVATLGTAKAVGALALPRLLPNDKCVRALSGFSLLSFTLGCKSLSFSPPLTLCWKNTFKKALSNWVSQPRDPYSLHEGRTPKPLLPRPYMLLSRQGPGLKLLVCRILEKH